MDNYSVLPTEFHDSYEQNVPNESQYEKHTYNFSGIRQIIFLITSVCVGLPALVWAFRLLYLHIKIREQISVFIVLLLLSDLIQLLLSLYIVTQPLRKYINWNHDMDLVFWSVLSLCGFQLHQLVALEGVLTLKYPLCSTRICSVPCYISILVPVISILNLSFFLFNLFRDTSVLLFCLGASFAPLILFAVTCAITCKASFTPVSKNTRSLFTVAILNFVMLYLPFMLGICLGLSLATWFEMSVCLMSLRVISDPILCVLVCRGNLRDVQTPQTHTEPNADETSV